MNLKGIDLELFKDLDPNAPGAWRIAVQVLVVVLVCVLVLGAGYWFDTQHQLVELEQAEKKEDELKETFKSKQMKAINLDAYKKQMEEMQRSFGAMLRQLPSLHLQNRCHSRSSFPSRYRHHHRRKSSARHSSRGCHNHHC